MQKLERGLSRYPKEEPGKRDDVFAGKLEQFTKEGFSV